jgi:hypothetical protein
MSRKVYAYVKSETCTSRGAVRPGSFVGLNATPVSRHGNYKPWLDGKRETLAIIARGNARSGYYRLECARLVAELLDWSLLTDQDLSYTMNDARYAKGKIALHIPPGIDGWMSTAACILTVQVARSARYSNREKAYIVSRSQAERFIEAIEEAQKRRRETR